MVPGGRRVDVRQVIVTVVCIAHVIDWLQASSGDRTRVTKAIAVGVRIPDRVWVEGTVGIVAVCVVADVVCGLFTLGNTILSIAVAVPVEVRVVGRSDVAPQSVIG